MAKEHGCEPPLPNLTPPHCRPHQLSIHSTAASPLALTRVHACCHWLPPAAAHRCPLLRLLLRPLSPAAARRRVFALVDGVVKEYGGHGIGKSLHIPPVICFHPGELVLYSHRLSCHSLPLSGCSPRSASSLRACIFVGEGGRLLAAGGERGWVLRVGQCTGAGN